MKKNNKRIEDYRIDGPVFTNSGAFILKKGSAQLRVVASDGAGWDHVSVSLATRCPTWEEMCYVKSVFFDDEEVVMQLHPAKSNWINNHKFCLHLWRPQSQEEIDDCRKEWASEWPYSDLQSHGEIPLPDGILVGVK